MLCCSVIAEFGLVSLGWCPWAGEGGWRVDGDGQLFPMGFQRHSEVTLVIFCKHSRTHETRIIFIFLLGWVAIKIQ